MQLFNKKSGGGASGEHLQPWHPNFRNTNELPDIKTVRTKFFINAACVIVAVGVVLYWLFTEYTIRTTDGELRNVSDQISRDSKGSREAIAQYKTFKENEAKIAELGTFLGGQKLLFSDFIVGIGQHLPDHVLVTGIQLKDTEVSIKGVVKSAPELASTISSAYEKQLRETPELTNRFSTISLTSLSRDSVTGYLNFEMILKFKK